MASIGHVTVGMAAARIAGDGLRAVALVDGLLVGGILCFPISTSSGCDGRQLRRSWGHRGATLLGDGLAVGLAIGAVAAGLKRPGRRVALVATAVLASHALLDTMTDGGLGCALLWPIGLTRYFAPWRPIPVAPIGFDFLSTDGALIALVELGLFSPVLVFALWPGRVVAK